MIDNLPVDKQLEHLYRRKEAVDQLIRSLELYNLAAGTAMRRKGPRSARDQPWAARMAS